MVVVVVVVVVVFTSVGTTTGVMLLIGTSRVGAVAPFVALSTFTF